ncbi:MAG TPA: 23S rRNA (guanosine(2251)-2'-O)-methyltransferase RlmB [Candidatus Spyradocola merdavium]|nr:23S rRNA (guanosine(2251)-2'-O)-methyltransferase RlmB [Candidatus Spyradocola merdavium]
MTERSSNFRPRREAPRETPENLIVGRNAVREALRAGRDMEKLLVSRGEATGSLREILALAREKGVVVQEVDRRRLDEMAENHQGVAALASMYAYSTLEEILALAREKGEPPFLVVLDGITDPHNLGAIVRTAECMGAHGVILPERRAVGLTPAAMKAAAGALEWIKVARVTNLTRALETLKAQNVWTYATDMDGEDYRRVNFSGGCALVIGAEGQGVSRLVRETCDQVVSIPMKGHIDSLNASVAAGVILAEIARQRG